MNKDEIHIEHGDDKNDISVRAFDRHWKLAQSGHTSNSLFAMSNEVQTRFFIDERIKSLLSEFGNTRGKRILHCGCGTGQWSIPFAKNGFSVTNIDLSHTAISLTEEAFVTIGLKGEFLVADICDLPFEDGQFDIVMSFGVLEHFEDIAPPVSEMCRVLKPGGIFHADVIPKRISVRTVEQLLQCVSTLLARLVKLRFRRLGDCMDPFKPDFYENSLPIENYLTALTDSNMVNARVFGVRAFPFITLPRFLDSVYTSILSKSRRRLARFDNSGSAFSVKWGAIFSLFAVKR